MSDYTPSITQVRNAYVSSRNVTYDPKIHWYGRLAGPAVEFERWLQQVKAEVWDEALSEAAEQGTIQIPDNPYRERQ